MSEITTDCPICTQNHLRARFATESCHQALSDFERQYPVSFALELEEQHEDKPAGSVADPRTTLAARGRPGGPRPGGPPMTLGGRQAQQQAAATYQPIAVRLGMRQKAPATASTRATSTKYVAARSLCICSASCYSYLFIGLAHCKCKSLTYRSLRLSSVCLPSLCPASDVEKYAR